ncbi:MAG TPA: ThaI family type II restriction endonuclease, partial [Candidatus Kapabacteria bacterium]|nr:ThaI family type II restriction endonuclease [Candidatus Kapabacteria bacterium]
YIPKETQLEIFNQIGRENYIKLPKEGTNPRGAEITSSALKLMVDNQDTIKIPIQWEKEIINYNPFNRWVELWQQD